MGLNPLRSTLLIEATPKIITIFSLIDANKDSLLKHIFSVLVILRRIKRNLFVQPEMCQCLAISESIPCLAISESIPCLAISESIPCLAISESIPCLAISESIPCLAISESIPCLAISESIPCLAISESIPCLAISESIPCLAISTIPRADNSSPACNLSRLEQVSRIITFWWNLIIEHMQDLS